MRVICGLIAGFAAALLLAAIITAIADCGPAYPHMTVRSLPTEETRS
jgi:hypothetical protein